MNVKKCLVDTFQITDEALLDRLDRLAEIRSLAKGDVMFEIGVVPDSVAFLINGATRGVMLGDKGQDITECVNTRFMEPLVPSLPLREPAIISIEAVMDSELLCFPLEVIAELIETNFDMLRLYNQLLLASLKMQVELRTVLQHPAMERYQWFLSRYPELEGKISGKYVASLLNITPVSLSRLRGQLRAKREA